ncbi:integrase core domain-containing protein [Burkholderia sp. FL-7-2-10-S1-D7]|uniref:integrase core domain-containing protein n=1 Tax=Burkholderia sp. FL-7-2-10-S1-D7 TaxID=1637866 RepID=UPI00359C6507
MVLRWSSISRGCDECLNEHRFVSMRHAKRLIEEWSIEYNTERPHSSLGYLTPVQFAQAHDAKQRFFDPDPRNSPVQK